MATSGSSSYHGDGRFNNILSALHDDGEQVEALTQLCDILSIAFPHYFVR